MQSMSTDTDFLFAVFVITIAYFVVKAVRGALPPQEGPPRIGGQPYDPDAPKGPVNEE